MTAYSIGNPQAAPVAASTRGSGDGWRLAGLALLSVRFIQGFIYWGGGSRRFIYAPGKLDPHAASWMANKFQSAMPGCSRPMAACSSPASRPSAEWLVAEIRHDPRAAPRIRRGGRTAARDAGRQRIAPRAVRRQRVDHQAGVGARIRLFDRVGHAIQLAHEGRVFLTEARAILLRVEQVPCVLAACKSGPDRADALSLAAHGFGP